MLYRLKTEAVPFFKKGLSTAVFDWDTWTKTYNVDENALEKVEPAYVTRGHKMDEISKSLGGWRKDGGGELEFTIHFPSMKFREHDEFTKGEMCRELMDIIQRDVNRFYEKFLNKNVE